MERSTVQSCLAAPAVLSQRPCKISINSRFGSIAGFSHFSYFGRNRSRKYVSADTKLAQVFDLCPTPIDIVGRSTARHPLSCFPGRETLNGGRGAPPRSVST